MLSTTMAAELRVGKLDLWETRAAAREQDSGSIHSCEASKAVAVGASASGDLFQNLQHDREHRLCVREQSAVSGQVVAEGARHCSASLL